MPQHPDLERLVKEYGPKKVELAVDTTPERKYLELRVRLDASTVAHRRTLSSIDAVGDAARDILRCA